MSKVTEESVMKALTHVIEPELFKDIVTLSPSTARPQSCSATG